MAGREKFIYLFLYTLFTFFHAPLCAMVHEDQGAFLYEPEIPPFALPPPAHQDRLTLGAGFLAAPPHQEMGGLTELLPHQQSLTVDAFPLTAQLPLPLSGGSVVISQPPLSVERLPLRNALTPVTADTALVTFGRTPDAYRLDHLGPISTVTWGSADWELFADFINPLNRMDHHIPLTVFFSESMRMSRAPVAYFQEALRLVEVPFYANFVVISGFRTDDLWPLFFLPDGRERFESLRQLELQRLEWSPPSEDWSVDTPELDIFRSLLNLERLVVDFAVWVDDPPRFTEATPYGLLIQQSDTSASFIEMFRAAMSLLSGDDEISTLQSIHFMVPFATTFEITDILYDQLEELVNLPVLMNLQSFVISAGPNVLVRFE